MVLMSMEVGNMGCNCSNSLCLVGQMETSGTSPVAAAADEAAAADDEAAAAAADAAAADAAAAAAASWRAWLASSSDSPCSLDDGGCSSHSCSSGMMSEVDSEMPRKGSHCWVVVDDGSGPHLRDHWDCSSEHDFHGNLLQPSSSLCSSFAHFQTELGFGFG